MNRYCQAYRRNPPGSRARGGICHRPGTWHIAFHHVDHGDATEIVICDDCIPGYLEYTVEMSATWSVTWTPIHEWFSR